MSDIAAKREARRRKILENSQARLQRITGRQEEPVITGDGMLRNTDFFEEVLQHNQDNVLFEDENGFRESIENNPVANDILNSLLNSVNQNEEKPTQEVSKFQMFLETKIHIILFSMIIYFIFAIRHENYVIGGSVFMPLFFWEIFELTFCRNKSTKPSLLGSVVVLSGVSAYKVKFVTICFQTIQQIFTDSIIYIFVFVLSHLFWINFLYDTTEMNYIQSLHT